MAYYIFKITITTILIVAISEIAKRSSIIGALLASIPLVSVLAIIWLYIDTKDVAKVSALSTSVFWFVLPSLTLFATLPLLLKQGYNFYISLGISLVVAIACYGIMMMALKQYGVNL